MGEKVLDMEKEGKQAFETEAMVDPVVTNIATPGDFAAQFPTPLDQTEIIAMCEEVSLLQTLPEQRTGLKSYSWRELDKLQFSSGCQYIGFADGDCPEEYTHDGDNMSVDLKNLGAKKSLTISDIMHSVASIGAGYGINRLVGGAPSGEGTPGGYDSPTFVQEAIADLKEKEVRLGMTLVLNGWDRLLAEGDVTNNALEFDGIANWGTRAGCTFHTNTIGTSGTFSAAEFDRWLMASCAKPTHIFGHPAAIQEMMSAYFALGAGAYSPQQVINLPNGTRVVPGFNFAGFVNTAIGRLVVVGDSNFHRNTEGTRFDAHLYAMRMTHNGEPLVYRLTQIPLALKDLTPGCTAISFEIWTKTALVIKHCCAHGDYTGYFTGSIATTCPVIGSCSAQNTIVGNP